MENKRTKFQVTVPELLVSDIDRCMSIHPPEFLINPTADYFLYIVHKIVTISNYGAKYKNLNKIPLSSRVLRYEVGKDYKKYLSYLIQWGFIETDNYYIVGQPGKPGKCKCYGLSNKYREDKLTRVDIKKAHLLKKIVQWKNEKFGENANDPLIGHMYDMMQQFTIDIESAKDFLQDQVDLGMLSPKKMSIELDKCERINRGDADKIDLFIVKDDYNRVHTNFTNISKKIREKFLMLNGKQVTSLDIVSCQPALLYTLFESYVDKMENTETWEGASFMNLDHTWGHREDPRLRYCNKNNWVDGDLDVEDEINMMPSTLGYQRVDHMVSVARSNLDKYKKALNYGIYEFFQNRYEKYHGEQLNRDAMKKLWITFVFGDGTGDYVKKIKEVWNNEFPALTRLLSHFKAGNYKVLAHSLQRKEADLIYNQLCPNLDMTYCTVHDSVIVDRDYVNKVSEIFTDVLKNNHIPTRIKVG